MGREVTIECADNGYMVRCYKEGKKGEPGKSIRKVASSKPEALRIASKDLDNAGGDYEEGESKAPRGQRTKHRTVKRRSSKRS